MKKNLLVLLLLCFILKGFAQDKISTPRLRDSLTVSLKGTEITINNQVFDYRILKYYKEEDLKAMSPTKLAQIRYIYLDSYRVINSNKCRNFKDIDVDIPKIALQRDLNNNTIVNVGSDCMVQVELFSQKILKDKMAEIAANFNSK